MRRFIRSALAFLALGSSLIGCGKSGDPAAPAPPSPSGDRPGEELKGTQSRVTFYVPGIT